MRIGLLSDVHSNLAGLLAVANEFEREGRMDHVVVAGDHLWGGPRPREVWQLLNERGWTLVHCNADSRATIGGAALWTTRHTRSSPPTTWPRSTASPR